MRAIELTIEIGRLPPPQASPNWHPMTAGADWVKLRAIRQFQREVRYYAINSRNLWERENGRWEAPRRAIIQPVFYKKRGGPQDPDNAIASLKGCVDVLVDEGILLGDSPGKLSWEPPGFHRAKENKLVLEIMEEVNEG